MSSETNTVQCGQGTPALCIAEEPAVCGTPVEADPSPADAQSQYCSVTPSPHAPTPRVFSSTLALFGPLDVTNREVFEEVVAARLEQARALIDAGDLDAAKRVLDEARSDFRTYTRAHPNTAVTPLLARHFATIHLYHGEIWDRRNRGEEGHHRAVEFYQAALRTANTAVEIDPRDAESLLIRSEIHHQLSDYGLAMADLQAAVRINSSHQEALDRYRCRLEELGQRFSARRQEAQTAHDHPLVILFLTEEIKVAEALRDSEQVMSAAPFNPDLGAGRAATNARWQEHQRRVEELSVLLSQHTSAQALIDIMDPIQEMTAQGHLTDQNLRTYVDRGLISFSCGPDGRDQINLTAAFQALGGPEKATTLQDIQRIGLTAQIRRSLEQETDANKRLYYQAKLHLLDGNIPAARLAFMDFKTGTEGAQDPEVLAMREEARGILRHFSLAAIDRFLEATGSLSAQRANSWLPLEQDISQRTGPLTTRFLQALRTFIQEGKADTLDEAVVVLRSEQQRLWSEFYRNPVIRNGWVVTLPNQRTPYYSPERAAEQRAAREFLAAFRRDPNATHPDVLSLRVEGGALVVPGQSVYNNREVIRVVVGRQGGTVRIQDSSSRIWVFPPADHDRVVVIQGNDLWSPHFRDRTEFYQGVHGGSAGHADAGRIAGDYAAGHPNTLDDLSDRLGGLGDAENAVLFDRDFENLVESEMRVGLERMQTAETRQQELLTLAESLRHRTGSYALAGEILEGLFAPEMERAMGEIPQADVQRIRTAIEADRDTVIREVQARLTQLATSDPNAYHQRFPSGNPSSQEFERMVVDAMNLKAMIQLRKLAMERIDARYESGELDHDSIAGRAWAIYDDMRDPLDKTWNLTDESWDAITGEIVITAVTLPLTMGVGTAVRVGLGGTSLALRLAAQGGWRYLAMRGAIFIAASTAEGLMMEGTKSAIFGTPSEMKNVGWNILMSGAFHGGGRLWGRIAPALGMGERAIQNASGLSRWARMGGNFAGTMATQTTVATTMGEIELLRSSHGSPHTFWQRLGGHAVRMVGFHYGTKAINVATGNLAMRAEQRSQLRMGVAHEAGRRGVGVDQAVAFARELVPSVTSERPGEARFVPIDQVQRRANARAEYDPESATFAALDQRTRGAVVSDTPAPASEGLRVVDHHGPYATPDGKNSTMKLLDMMETALTQSRGRVDRAIERLNIREVTTDNLADGGWSVWIARNQHRVLSDPNLRALIRQATHFEDFTAFGSNYDRTDPAVELQAALFARYGEILRANGIQGSDRFSPTQAERVMTEALTAIDAMVGNPAARREAAEGFWRNVDVATAAAREAVMPNASHDGQVVFYDMSRLSQFPVFVQWLAIPQAHTLNLQVTVQPMPPAQANGTAVPRSLAFVAIPNGRTLPSGKGLLSVVEAMNAAEAARARELGLEPNTWFGKDNVILPNPQRGGTVLTPEEISAVLRRPELGLFERTEGTPTDPEATRAARPGARGRSGDTTPDGNGGAPVRGPARTPDDGSPPIQIDRQAEHGIEFQANSYLEFYGAPEQRRTLEALAQDGGGWGNSAREFQAGLRELRAQLDRYAALNDSADPAVAGQRRAAAVEVLRLQRRLEVSWYDRMVTAHDTRVQALDRELLPLTGVLSAHEVAANVQAREQGRDTSWRFDIEYRSPEELSRHIGTDFDLVSPSELVSISFGVRDWAEANQVVQRIDGTDGLRVVHQTDLAAIRSGYTGKEITVRLPSGREVPLVIEVGQARPAENYGHLRPGSVVEIPLADIVPTQGKVFSAQVDAYQSGAIHGDLPEIRVINGVPYVSEGHHRLYAARRNGDATVRVRVYDPATDPYRDLVPTLPERATTWEAMAVQPSDRVFAPARQAPIPEPASRVIPIEGRHWRSFLHKRAWNYGVPVLEGDQITIYRAPRVATPAPMSPRSVELFEGLVRSLIQIGSPRRMRIRVETLRQIYQASSPETRAKIERVVEAVSTEVGAARSNQRLAYVRERLNKAIANYGQQVAEAPIERDIRVGTVQSAETPGVWRHYTDRSGFEAILRSQRLRPNAAVEGRGPRLWVTDRAFNLAQVHDQIYQNGSIRGRVDQGKGDYVVVFRMRQGAEATFNPGKNPIEFWTDRALEFGAMDVLYAGENPRLVDTGP